MVATVKSLLGFLVSLFRSRSELQAEILALRHQVNVLRRSAPRCPKLGNTDRLLFICLYRLWPGVLRSIIVVQPETVVRWHRQGFKAFWRLKSRSARGRPKVPKEIRDLIREISLANPLWGAPRIHGEILKLGIEVAQSTVAKYLARGRRPPSQSWKTFLRNHTDGIVSIDFFVTPTVNFRLLFVLVAMRHARRELVQFGITTHPAAEWVAGQITEAFPWDTAPSYLIRDRDGAFGQVFKRRLKAMGIKDRPTAPRSPWQNGHAERLIGSIRRECLDHVIVLNEKHLRHLLRAYADYYNNVRTHLSLDKDAPRKRPVQRTGLIKAAPCVGGLHHSFTRV